MKRSPIRRDSPRARRRRAEWKKERDEHLEENPFCELLKFVPHRCQFGLQVHHVMPRSMGGTRGPTGPKRTLCGWAHDWVEKYRAWAKANGFLVRREARRF